MKRLLSQACSLKQRIKKLNSDKKALSEEVAKHKWYHILTKRENTHLKHKLEKAHKEIAELKEALRIAKLPKNSSNSSRAPSTDFYKPKRNKNYSLRQKTGRKPGGQPGHEGPLWNFAPMPRPANRTRCGKVHRLWKGSDKYFRGNRTYSSGNGYSHPQTNAH